MKKTGLFFSVILMGAVVFSCNKSKSKSPEPQKQSQPAQSKPAATVAPTPAPAVTEKPKVRIARADGDNLVGTWASSRTGMKAVISKNKAGYYIQYSFGPVNTFYGRYKLDGNTLSCLKPAQPADGGEIENEYVHHARFVQINNGRELEFSCDACETDRLTWVDN